MTIKKWIKEKIDLYTRGRAVSIRDNDVMIVSYPKSGNTWMRFLIGNYLYEELDFINMENLIPDIYVVNEKKLSKMKSPRIMKSHEYFDPRYKKCIYIVRDPRSVAVSYYHFLKKYGRIDLDSDFYEYLKVFVKGGYDNYAAWDEHVMSWYGIKKDKTEDFIFIKYEDMLAAPEKVLRDVLEFLGENVSDECVEKAVSSSSFEKMRLKESYQSGKSEVLKQSNGALPFVRSGRKDEWKEYFDEKCMLLIEKRFGPVMKETGYDH
ncbi:sulfotransferase domain-containing protein [Amphritea pacifica]|uniref:Sulfotransferase domain-containing protein n=1 Tax=Amphritea pacifica TaxID=2811233 RepID=A0ABS2WCY5_9GAMM|nr:sulfotransferase domain-containing protein [Amphritea pacifica]MBN0989585.1 sulfotransferase domain-containing protein [Amphritea pacifica]